MVCSGGAVFAPPVGCSVCTGGGAVFAPLGDAVFAPLIGKGESPSFSMLIRYRFDVVEPFGRYRGADEIHPSLVNAASAAMTVRRDALAAWQT